MLTISDLYDRYRYAVRTEGLNGKWTNHYADLILEWEEQTGRDAAQAVYGHVVPAQETD